MAKIPSYARDYFRGGLQVLRDSWERTWIFVTAFECWMDKHDRIWVNGLYIRLNRSWKDRNEKENAVKKSGC